MLRTSLLTATLLSLTVPALAAAPATVAPIDQRFAEAKSDEVPDFRRHVVPLMGKLGCNGRACHGSFQGQGGFRLSLFGYDFNMDHEGLIDRVDTESPQDSYAIDKPTLEIPHRGGRRYEKGSWQHHVFLKWIAAGAKGYEVVDGDFVGIEAEPSEIVFQSDGQTQPLKVTAVWKDGTREDVTPLCRFQTNDDQVANISKDGVVTAGQPGDTHVVIFYDNGVLPVPVMRPVSDRVGKNYPVVETPTKVDELVVDKLRKLGIVPSDVCSDAEFLRRVSLDMTGSLPTAEQVQAFLADPSSDKRAKKIDELLDSPAYAAWWTTQLCDYTGNNDFQLRNFLPQYNRGVGSASKAWYDWIYKRVENNTPYDELVEGIVLATSRKDGQSYTDYCQEMSAMYNGKGGKSFADQDDMVLYWARREFRDAEPRAINFAYAFLGIRIQCAQCHKHPFDQWTKEDFAEFTNFFRQVTASNGRPTGRDEQQEYREILKALDLDPDLRGNQQRREFGRLLAEGKTVPFSEVYVGTARRSRGDDAAETEMTHAKLLGGEAFELKRDEDIRKPLMEWLRGKDNPLFARAFVNRVWASYFHRGIVEPPDDNSLANPPANKPLLDYLAQGFIESGFDMKWVHRTIANSATYQRTWQPNETNTMDLVNFSRAVPRRLPAEVAYDAIRQATSNDEVAADMHADVDGRAIAIPGASNRNNARNSSAYALQIFGKSVRESNCDCDRSDEPSLLQAVFLQNDNELLAMLADRNSWVTQIERESRPQTARQPERDSGRRRPNDYDERVRQMRRQIERAENGGNQKLADATRQRLREYIKRFGAEEEPAKPEPQAKPESFDAESVVRQAYLRTLSRNPKPDELERAKQFVTASENPIEGTRSLLWALLNTKEFIVNH